MELLDSLEGKPGAKALSQIAGLSFKHDGVISHNQKAEPIDPDLIPRLPYHKVDVDKSPELAAIFGVRSVPTLLWIPMEGNPSVSQGALPKSQLESIITNTLLKKEYVSYLCAYGICVYYSIAGASGNHR